MVEMVDVLFDFWVGFPVGEIPGCEVIDVKDIEFFQVIKYGFWAGGDLIRNELFNVTLDVIGEDF